MHADDPSEWLKQWSEIIDDNCAELVGHLNVNITESTIVEKLIEKKVLIESGSILSKSTPQNTNRQFI